MVGGFLLAGLATVLKGSSGSCSPRPSGWKRHPKGTFRERRTKHLAAFYWLAWPIYKFTANKFIVEKFIVIGEVLGQEAPTPGQSLRQELGIFAVNNIG